MDKDLIRKYKENTGKYAIVVIEFDTCRFIPDFALITNSDAKMLQTEYLKGELPSQEYVNWLEEQLKERLK